jgi:hypothetical protein
MSDDMTKEEAENFYERHEIAVKVTICTADGHFLVQRTEDGGIAIPSRPLRTDRTSLATAHTFFKELTGLTPGEYYVIRQEGFLDYDLNDVRSVLYSSEMVETVPLLDQRFEWVDGKTLRTNESVARIYSIVIRVWRL